MPSDHRNHYASEDAAGHDFEEHIRQAVGRVVGVAEAGVPDGLEKTSDRPKPTSRAARVSPATPAATDARPALTLAAWSSWTVRRPGARADPAAQQRRALDHGGEAHPLADQVERRDRDKREQPEPPRQGLGGSSTDRGTERVGAAVTEHGSTCQIGRQTARRSADCRRCADADQA